MEIDDDNLFSFDHLVDLQKRSPKRCPRHDQLNNSRRKLIDIIIQHAWYKQPLIMSVIFQSIWMIDSMIPYPQVKCDQVLAYACLSLSSKYENNMEHFDVRSVGDKVKLEDVAEAEMFIWEKLDFNLHFPNLHFYVRHLNHKYEDGGDGTTRNVAYRFLLTSLYDTSYLNFSPMCLAISSLAISCAVMSKVDAMHSYVQIYNNDNNNGFSQLQKCIDFLLTSFRKTAYQSKLDPVFEFTKTHLNRVFVLENLITTKSNTTEKPKRQVKTVDMQTQTDESSLVPPAPQRPPKLKSALKVNKKKQQPVPVEPSPTPTILKKTIGKSACKSTRTTTTAPSSYASFGASFSKFSSKDFDFGSDSD